MKCFLEPGSKERGEREPGAGKKILSWRKERVEGLPTHPKILNSYTTTRFLEVEAIGGVYDIGNLFSQTERNGMPRIPDALGDGGGWDGDCLV